MFPRVLTEMRRLKFALLCFQSSELNGNAVAALIAVSVGDLAAVCLEYSGERTRTTVEETRPADNLCV